RIVGTAVTATEWPRHILRTSYGIWSRVLGGSGDVRIQYVSSINCSNFTLAIAAPSITASEWYCLRIASKVAVAAENGVPTVAIGNDKDVGFIISRACNQPCLCFARVIGGSQVGVPNRASDLEAAKFVFQNDVEHTRNCR